MLPDVGDGSRFVGSYRVDNVLHVSSLALSKAGRDSNEGRVVIASIRVAARIALRVLLLRGGARLLIF